MANTTQHDVHAQARGLTRKWCVAVCSFLCNMAKSSTSLLLVPAALHVWRITSMRESSADTTTDDKEEWMSARGDVLSCVLAVLKSLKPTPEKDTGE